MLKIKDNVNLKELENFGFIRCIADLYHLAFDEYNYINIYEDSKEIYFVCLNNEYCKDKIYDLIEAGLVEKVVE